MHGAESQQLLTKEITMDQQDSIIAEIRAHRLREQKKKLLLEDAENRRRRVAAILNEWAMKTMTEYGPATMQSPDEEREEHNRPGAEETRPQGSHEPDHASMKAPDGEQASV
jgi:hypothetical protein